MFLHRNVTKLSQKQRVMLYILVLNFNLTLRNYNGDTLQMSKPLQGNA